MKTKNEAGSLVDVFHGNGTVELPPEEGIAAAWDWRKAQVGNTHPGACLPFGMVSVCPYAGAYPTGYGLYAPSYCGETPRLFETKTATGIAHFQHSGTGDAMAFYNYLRIIPQTHAHESPARRYTLVDETGCSGYYACTLRESAVRVELTVTPRAALHRYTFPLNGAAHVRVDITNGGLACENRQTYPSDGYLHVLSDTSAHGAIEVLGVWLYFHVEVGLEHATTLLWKGDNEPYTGTHLQVATTGATPGGILVSGTPRTDGTVDVRIGFSFRSVEQACANLAPAPVSGLLPHATGRQPRIDGAAGAPTAFTAARGAAKAAWQTKLSAVTVTGGSDGTRRIFYSCLYHCLVKPIDCSGESPFWRDGPDSDACFLDFATLWDQYKTQLPLVMTLYPDTGAAIAKAIVATMGHLGHMPTGLLIERDVNRFDNQARGLAHFTLADAFLRGVNGIDWPRAAELMCAYFDSDYAREFVAAGFVRPYAHTLDLAGAAWAAAIVADHLPAKAEGPDHARTARMRDLSANWRHVFDRHTGVLKKDSAFYEGTHWNYSFRPLPGMDTRVADAGGPERFAALMDEFFGFNDAGSCAPAPPDDSLAPRLSRDHRFEGLNNESDMEAPYVYAFAGRHDRVCEVVRTIMRQRFGEGPGGLPGNDDSGGLSSWYVWSAIGLFPVAGQDLYVIGSPSFNATVLRLPGGDFTIRAHDTSDANIYVARAELNGCPLEAPFLRVAAVAPGNTLTLHMAATHSGFGSVRR